LKGSFDLIAELDAESAAHRYAAIVVGSAMDLDPTVLIATYDPNRVG
jgi:hypothetical protein